MKAFLLVTSVRDFNNRDEQSVQRFTYGFNNRCYSAKEEEEEAYPL